jgi:hypothetical protein
LDLRLQVQQPLVHHVVQLLSVGVPWTSPDMLAGGIVWRICSLHVVGRLPDWHVKQWLLIARAGSRASGCPPPNLASHSLSLQLLRLVNRALLASTAFLRAAAGLRHLRSLRSRELLVLRQAFDFLLLPIHFSFQLCIQPNQRSTSAQSVCSVKLTC